MRSFLNITLPLLYIWIVCYTGHVLELQARAWYAFPAMITAIAGLLVLINFLWCTKR